MTIIDEQPQDARAKRRINPLFRPDGGPLPHGNPPAFPIVLKKQKDQSNTWESRQQRSTPLQAALAFFRVRTMPWQLFGVWDSVGQLVGQRPTASQVPVICRFCVGQCPTLFPIHRRERLMPAKP